MNLKKMWPFEKARHLGYQVALRLNFVNDREKIPVLSVTLVSPSERFVPPVRLHM